MAKKLLILDQTLVTSGNFQICYKNKGRETLDYLTVLANPYILQKKPLFKKNPEHLGKINHLEIEFKDIARTRLVYNNLKTGQTKLEVDVFQERSELVDFLKNPENHLFIRPIRIYLPSGYQVVLEKLS